MIQTFIFFSKSSGADKLKIPGGGNNLGAREARAIFAPPLSDFCPPPEGFSGGGNVDSGGGKILK